MYKPELKLLKGHGSNLKNVDNLDGGMDLLMSLPVSETSPRTDFTHFDYLHEDSKMMQVSDNSSILMWTERFVLE